MEINDRNFRKAANRKQLELLRQNVWRTLSETLQATPNSDEGVRLLLRAVGTVVDSSDSPFVLAALANSLRPGGVISDAYSSAPLRQEVHHD